MHWILNVLAVFLSVVVGFVITNIPDIDPHPMVHQPLRPLPQRGDAHVTALDNVEYLFADDNSFVGPESFVFVDDDTAVTGINDGRIVKITGLVKGPIRYNEVTRTGEYVEGCGDIDKELVCGRPLGMKLYPLDTNKLIVADNHGILMVDLTSGAVDVLASPQDHNLTLPNDIEVADNGDIYWTHSGPTYRHTIHHVIMACAPSGKLFKYNRDSQKVEVLKDDLRFPNGITMSHDGKRLLIASCCTASVNQFYLEGPKMGTVEPFITDLQGTPDNIRRNVRADGKVSYFVGLGSKRSAPFALENLVGPYPFIKRVIASLPLNTFSSLVPKFGQVLDLREDDRDPTKGTIGHYYIDYQDRKVDGKSVYWASEAEIHNGYLYIGSWCAPYLSRVKIE
ncbi:hypothetical protein SARC_05268 [Sphaeroforma arctica JP610]|uniref:Strictosidine synthase conserved region domain-containing protein n=1 Tax=Sphaeroforma arctica JP610 TaxID=667725 RepID=A0A0L0G2M5_9EUKA|nr:hypothetical protein SARC_05268 [Sphaeroforma arctica JP610]KNC82453.1 hypothetical protein SARC_05268 [Sphaeroforma arctica JP610]|eukprot:XP_014156355.1 hypothetical protein SARC_05268 [Sphaeroforma arctica JP610]